MIKNKFYKNKNINFAVIGSGISGLTMAMLLSKKYKVTLYEANNYLGGHALTLNEKLLVDNKFKNPYSKKIFYFLENNSLFKKYSSRFADRGFI